MFLEGMRKPWWIAALVVWLVVLIGLQEYRGYDFQTAFTDPFLPSSARSSQEARPS